MGAFTSANTAMLGNCFDGVKVEFQTLGGNGFAQREERA